MPIVVFVGTEEELLANKGRRALMLSQAAARLNIGERQFRRYIDDGEISPYEEQLGPVKFFEEHEVDRLRELRKRRY